jgi:hypothetical protein
MRVPEGGFFSAQLGRPGQNVLRLPVITPQAGKKLQAQKEQTEPRRNPARHEIRHADSSCEYPVASEIMQYDKAEMAYLLWLLLVDGGSGSVTG